MLRSGRHGWDCRALAIGAIALLAVLGLAACGGDDGEDSAAEQSAERTDEGQGADDGEARDDGQGRERAPESADEEHPDPPDAGIGDRPGGGGGEEDPGPGTREATSSEERAIARSVREYLAALRQRDGEVLCAETFVEGALEQVRLPVEEGSCADSVAASIGRPLEPGGPRWLGARLAGARTVIMDEGGGGRLTGTVANRLSNTDRDWIEDDVVYLRETGGEWRIVKPSAVFYRAIGHVEVPIRAITPP